MSANPFNKNVKFQKFRDNLETTGNNVNQNKSHPYNRGKNFGRNRGTSYRRNAYEKQIKPEDSTPWETLQNDLKQSQSAISELPKEEKSEDNHKKFLIESKQQQKTTWEPFTSDELSTPSGRIAKKLSDSRKKGKKFDGKQLTSNEANFLRRAITKTTCKAKGVNLEDAIKDMKKNGVKRIKINK